jgi:hypothetical protein
MHRFDAPQSLIRNRRWAGQPRLWPGTAVYSISKGGKTITRVDSRPAVRPAQNCPVRFGDEAQPSGRTEWHSVPSPAMTPLIPGVHTNYPRRSHAGKYDGALSGAWSARGAGRKDTGILSCRAHPAHGIGRGSRVRSMDAKNATRWRPKALNARRKRNLAWRKERRMRTEE